MNINKSYTRSVMIGLLPKDANVDDLDAEDGLHLQADAHQRLLTGLNHMRFAPLSPLHFTGEMKPEVEAGRYGDIVLHAAGVFGLRFSVDPDDEHTYVWIFYDER